MGIYRLPAFRTTKSDTSFGGSQLHRGNDLVKSIREVNANQAFCICGHVPNSTRWASDSVAGGTLPWNLLHKPTERSFKLRLDLRSKRRRPVNYRVGLFVRVPGRIGSTTGQLTGRQARANHFLSGSISIAGITDALIPQELLSIASA